MLQYEMSAKVRNTIGKGASRQLRRAGVTPAVLYGSAGVANIAIEIETKPLTKNLIEIQDQNAVFTLNVGAENGTSARHVVVKDVQVHPLKDTLVHVDFYEIDLNKPTVLQVPLRYAGKAKGVDMGGDMHIFRNSVTLKGLMLEIPDFVEINVSNLGIGQEYTCNDIPLPANVTLADNGDAKCVSVTASVGAAAAA